MNDLQLLRDAGPQAAPLSTATRSAARAAFCSARSRASRASSRARFTSGNSSTGECSTAAGSPGGLMNTSAADTTRACASAGSPARARSAIATSAHGDPS